MLVLEHQEDISNDDPSTNMINSPKTLSLGDRADIKSLIKSKGSKSSNHDIGPILNHSTLVPKRETADYLIESPNIIIDDQAHSERRKNIRNTPSNMFDLKLDSNMVTDTDRPLRLQQLENYQTQNNSGDAMIREYKIAQ